MPVSVPDVYGLNWMISNDKYTQSAKCARFLLCTERYLLYVCGNTFWKLNGVYQNDILHLLETETTFIKAWQGIGFYFVGDAHLQHVGGSFDIC